MSGWNYRIVKHINYTDKPDYIYHNVCEVYYDDLDNPNGMVPESDHPYGEDLETLLKDFELIKKALDKPVLVFDWNLEKFVNEMPEV